VTEPSKSRSDVQSAPVVDADNRQSDGVGPPTVQLERVGGPARGYSWPPFAVGNRFGELSVRHGGYSAKRISERAAVIVREVLELAPWLDDDSNVFAISEYAMARAQAELLTVAIETYIQQANIAKLNARLVEAANSSRREAAAQRASLGLDPRSMAELRNLSSLTNLNEGLLAQLVPELPGAIAEALAAIGAGEQIEVFKATFVAALRRGPAEED